MVYFLLSLTVLPFVRCNISLFGYPLYNKREQAREVQQWIFELDLISVSTNGNVRFGS